MYNITAVAPTRPVGPENGERDRLPDGSFPENIKVRSIDGKSLIITPRFLSGQRLFSIRAGVLEIQRTKRG